MTRSRFIQDAQSGASGDSLWWVFSFSRHREVKQGSEGLNNTLEGCSASELKTSKQSRNFSISSLTSLSLIPLTEKLLQRIGLFVFPPLLLDKHYFAFQWNCSCPSSPVTFLLAKPKANPQSLFLLGLLGALTLWNDSLSDTLPNWLLG
jgi:hypothetical protein